MDKFKVILIFAAVLSLAQGLDMILFLKDFNARNKSANVFKLYDSLDSGLTRISLEDINEDVGFLIFQVHSYVYNLTLSHNSSGVNNTITSTNNGLVYTNDKKTDNPVFYVYNNHPENVSTLIVVTLYENEDPIPGGCDLIHGGSAIPYQLVTYGDEIISVVSEPPSVIGVSCEANDVIIETYHTYLSEQAFDVQRYMSGVESMLDVDSIRANGRKIQTLNGKEKFQRMFSAYRGTGEVFALIVTYGNRSAAYVPAATYACDLTRIGETCFGPVTYHWKWVCAFLLFFGLFVCFYGHKFFRTTVFLSGYASGVFITHVLLATFFTLSVKENATISLIVGFVFASAWLFIWWKFGIPYISINLTLILAGFLIASVMFYTGIADWEVFRSNVNYWLIFTCILVSHLLLCTMFPYQGHLFCCSMLGAYVFTVALCYYIGGNLQYIILNTYRRLTIKDFNLAVVDPPYQVPDIAHTVMWIVITGLGHRYQYFQQLGKPPFPPSRPPNPVNHPSEETPLVFAEEAEKY